MIWISLTSYSICCFHHSSPRYLHGHTRIFALGLFVDLGSSLCSIFATLAALCALCENESSVSLWFSTHTHMFVFYWYLQVFCSWLSQTPFRSKVVLHLLARFVPSHMIFPNSLVKLAWLPKLLRDTKPQTYDISFSAMPPPGLSLTWRDWGNASFKTVTLPPTVDTLCASDHYPRFLPGSHLLCELIFVMWDMFFLTCGAC